MPNKDYYAILGVQKSASQDEVKKAFRRLAHEHHPDKGGDQQKFKDINEAYQILGDADKRSKYDQFGSAAFEQGGMGGGGFGSGFNGQGFGGFEDFGDLGSMFGDMFGFQGGGGRQKKGKDIEVDVSLDFMESVKGTTAHLQFPRHEHCSSCNGSGAEPGSSMEQCATCKGAGQIAQNVRTVFGTIQSAVQCPECHGRGERPKQTCKQCKGTGVERTTAKMDVAIPAGIADSEAIRISNGGEYPGAGGRAGDLFVRVHVKPHPVFERQRYDIHSTVEVPYSTLLLGGEVSIETVDGAGSLKIPEHTQPTTTFKLRGKGIPHIHSSGRGDHLVTVQTPSVKKLTKEQRAALESLGKIGL